MSLHDDRRDRTELITSSANPSIKFARSLHRKRMRLRERAMLVEGTRTISAAIDHGTRLRTLFIDADRQADLPPDWLASTRTATERVLLVEPSLFAELADTEHPQPAIAVCDLPTHQIPSDCTLVLALDAVRDPGNLGTLLRSSAAAGADAVVVLPGTVDPTSPKVVRASAGSVFAVPVVQVADVPSVLSSAFAVEAQIIVADGDGDREYDELDWTRPTLVVIGGEADGVDDRVRTYADFIVRIPMARDIESLNAGVAGAVLLFEAARQRRRNR